MIEKIKPILYLVLVKLNDGYLFLNQELLFAWRRVLNKQSNNKITNFFKVLIEDPATALFLNTILFYIISSVLFGNAGLLGYTMYLLTFLNIVVFLVNKLGWIDKLK